MQGVSGQVTMYDLVGVIEHQGPSMRSGHYHAYTQGIARVPQGQSEGPDIGIMPGGTQSQQTEAVSLSQTTPNGNLEASKEAGSESSNPGGPESSAQHTGSNANEAGGLNHGVEGGGSGSVGQAVPDCSGADASPETQESGDSLGVAGSKERGDSAVPGSQIGSKKNEAWYKISDEHVQRTSLQQVLSTEAYVLLYERRAA